MMKNLSVISFSLGILLMVDRCSVSHETMRGSVVMVFDKEAHIGIGSDDGLQVGDRVAIYRTKEVPSTLEAVVPDRSGGYRPKMHYELVRVSTGKVTRILSEQYAAIEVLEAEVQTSDIVEKTQRP